MDLIVGGDLNVTVTGDTAVTSVGDVTITTPNLNVNGNILATGDITDQINTTNESIRDLRGIYDAHTHSGVQSGDANTGVPNQLE
jgi:hypothetical protein